MKRKEMLEAAYRNLSRLENLVPRVDRKLIIYEYGFWDGFITGCKRESEGNQLKVRKKRKPAIGKAGKK